MENKLKTNKMNKKGAIFSVIVFIVLALLGIYMFLWLPVPSFAKIRSFVNYMIMILIWLILQVGLIYGYYKLGSLAVKGLHIYKTKIQMGTIKVKNFLLSKA